MEPVKDAEVKDANEKDVAALKQLLTPAELEVLTVEPQALTARFSPCGKYLAAGGFDGRVRRWDVSGERAAPLEDLTGLGGWVQEVAFSPDGQRLYAVDSWGQLQAWQQDGGETLWRREAAHQGWIRGLDVQADGRQLATGAADRRVRLWDAANGAPLAELDAEDDVHSVAFGPDNTVLAGLLQGRIRQWSASSFALQRDLDAGELFLYHRIQEVGGVKAIRFSLDGKTLAAGGCRPKNGGTVQGAPLVLLFDFESGKVRETLVLGPEQHCFAHDVWLHSSGAVAAVTSGTPGSGRLVFQRPGDEEPLYASSTLANCHSLSVHRESGRIAVASTNKGSNGNGRRVDKDGNYVANHSPIHLLQLPPA